jgi:hypothetical protein
MDRLRALGFLLCVPAVGALAGVIHPAAPPVEGRVAEGAVVSVFDPAVLMSQLRERLAARQADEASAEAAVAAARAEWRIKTERRDEAARVLRVASQSNAADLGLCRGRSEAADAEAEQAFVLLEQSIAVRDKIFDLLPLLSDVSAEGQVPVGPGGSFSLPPSDGAWRIVLVRASATIWLRVLPPRDAGPLEFLPEHRLTTEALRAMLSAQVSP